MAREPQLLSLGIKVALGAMAAAVAAGVIGLVVTRVAGPWTGGLALVLVAMLLTAILGVLLGNRVGRRVRELSRTTSTLSAYSPRATQAMARLQDGLEGLEASMEHVSELADRVKEVEEMAALISRVAQQTHLLAINATMEAARAGESGRGFALVAGEFRRLAEGTEESAERVTALARGLLADMDEVVGSLRGSVAGVGHGRDDAARATAELDRLAQELNDAVGGLTLNLGFEPVSGSFTLERVDSP